MLKKKRYVVICILVVIIAFLGIGVYAGDIFWLFKDYTVSFPVKYMTNEEQMIEVDGYSIRMEKSLYESLTGVGFYIFRISNKQGKVENDMLTSLGVPIDGESFGNDNRFGLLAVTDDACSYSIEGRKDGDDLIIYMKLYGICDEVYKPTVYLHDEESLEEERMYFDNRCIYAFESSRSSKGLTFAVNDGEVHISQHGLRIAGGITSNVKSLSIYYDSGECVDVIKNGEDSNEMWLRMEALNQSGEQNLIYEAKRIFDIENISYIKLNDSICELE